MAVRRHGNPAGFWDDVAADALDVSSTQEIGHFNENIAIYVTTDAATTISVEVGHSGADSSYGTGVDTEPTVWHTLYYLNTDTACQLVFGGAGSACLIIPDFTPGWVRLSTSGAATLTAGWEAHGE